MNNDLISRSELKKAFAAWKNMDDYYHDTDCDDIPLSEAYDLIDNAPTVSLQDIYQEGYYDGHLQGYTKAINGSQGKFECRIKIKDLIAMLLEFDMNEKATICTTDEYNENNLVISITDMRGKEE